MIEGEREQDNKRSKVKKKGQGKRMRWYSSLRVSECMLVPYGGPCGEHLVSAARFLRPGREGSGAGSYGTALERSHLTGM